MAANLHPTERIQLGVIGRPHGVRGLVKVTSHTADPADLTSYGPLSDSEGLRYVLHWRGIGIAEVVRMVDGAPVKVTDRLQAERLTNTRLYIDRASLPAADDDEFYLGDLVKLVAVDTEGAALGTVAAVHDYGAGASLEIVGGGAPLLIPFTAACVPVVDLAGGRLVVIPPEEIVVPGNVDSIAAQDAETALLQDGTPVVPQDADSFRLDTDSVVQQDAGHDGPDDANVAGHAGGIASPCRGVERKQTVASSA